MQELICLGYNARLPLSSIKTRNEFDSIFIPVRRDTYSLLTNGVLSVGCFDCGSLAATNQSEQILVAGNFISVIHDHNCTLK